MSKLLEINGFKSGSPLTIRNKSETEAEIVIYADIGKDYFGDGSMISAKNFSDELKKVPDSVNTLNIRLNSPGGDVFDGIAIYNRLKQHKAKKIIHIDGLAASIASIIALAGDEIIIGEGSLFMVHLPWSWVVGNRNDLDNTINLLVDIEEQMIGIYAKKSKKGRTEIRTMLEKETWLNDDETIEMGFAHRKSEDTLAVAASVFNKPWINKKPEKFVSQSDVVQERISALRKKLNDRLARK